MSTTYATVKEFILHEFLPGEDPNELTESTPLMSGGILDSIATMKLVAFIEDHYKITLEDDEVNVDYLDNLADITQLIDSKVDVKA